MMLSYGLIGAAIGAVGMGLGIAKDYMDKKETEAYINKAIEDRLAQYNQPEENEEEN